MANVAQLLSFPLPSPQIGVFETELIVIVKQVSWALGWISALFGQAGFLLSVKAAFILDTSKWAATQIPKARILLTAGRPTPSSLSIICRLWIDSVKPSQAADLFLPSSSQNVCLVQERGLVLAKKMDNCSQISLKWESRENQGESDTFPSCKDFRCTTGMIYCFLFSSLLFSLSPLLPRPHGRWSLRIVQNKGFSLQW